MLITNETYKNVTAVSVLNSALTRNGIDMPAAPGPRFKTPELPTRAELTDAAVKVLRDGNDPATDPEVQRLTTAYTLAEAGLSKRIELAHSQDYLEYLNEQVPAIVKQLSRKFAAAVKTMRDTIPTTGHADLSKGVQYVPGGGTDKLMALGNAADALNTATIITSTWKFLMEAAEELPTPNRRYDRLWYCKPTWEQFNAHQLAGHLGLNTHGREHNIWDMLNDGITIDLATTADEYEQRVQQVTEGQQAAERHAAQAAKDRRPNYSIR